MVPILRLKSIFNRTLRSAIFYRKSVCRLHVIVTFLHPTQPVGIYRNVSTPFGILPPPDLHAKFYGNHPRGTLPSWTRTLNAKGVPNIAMLDMLKVILQTTQDSLGYS